MLFHRLMSSGCHTVNVQAAAGAVGGVADRCSRDSQRRRRFGGARAPPLPRCLPAGPPPEAILSLPRTAMSHSLKTPEDGLQQSWIIRCCRPRFAWDTSPDRSGMPTQERYCLDDIDTICSAGAGGSWGTAAGCVAGSAGRCHRRSRRAAWCGLSHVAESDGFVPPVAASLCRLAPVEFQLHHLVRHPALPAALLGNAMQCNP